MKTIKDSVIELSGKLPSRTYTKYSNAVGWYISRCGKLTHAVDCVWFEPEEFESCAKRMGYINGYEWGKEYPTNGKRPELPDDVLVVVRHSDGELMKNPYPISEWDWVDMPNRSFIIKDPRHKPDDTSYLNALTKDQSLTHSEEGLTHSGWWDYENAKFLENPSVGSSILCSCSNDGHGVVMDKFAIQVNVVAIHDGKIVVCRQDGKTYFAVSRSEIAPLDHATRKAEMEREKVIEAAMKCCQAFPSTQLNFAEKLYDAGMLVLPTKKSDTED